MKDGSALAEQKTNLKESLPELPDRKYEWQ